MVAVTGELKNKVDKLWNIMWTGGDSNPISILEQMTYLMFIHDLDAKDIEDAKALSALKLEHKSIFDGTFISIDRRTWRKDQFRWSKMKNVGGTELFDTMSNGVFPFIRSMSESGDTYGAYLSDARFNFPNEIILQQVFDQLTSLYDSMISCGLKDIRGDVYEYMLSKMATSKVNGQFRTPRHIIRMMVELMKPKIDDVICDPACGTAGFLVSAAEYVMENNKDELLKNEYDMDHFSQRMFTGFDKDGTMLRISAMNLMLHNVNRPNIRNMDSLSKNNDMSDEFSLILANPPFKGTCASKDMISEDLIAVADTTKTELLFVAAMLRMLRIGGRCAVIVPDGVLFGSSNAHKNLRREIIDNNTLVAVISMPSGVFKPYAGVSTAILVFTKTGNGGTDNVWFYDMKADGYSLDDKRSVIDENDIPDIISCFGNLEKEKDRSRTDCSFLVPVKEIADNGYDLSINKYKKVVYKEVKYRPSKDILKEIDVLNEQLSVEIKKLKQMLE